jgi:hypothetical protein
MDKQRLIQSLNEDLAGEFGATGRSEQGTTDPGNEAHD